MVKLEYCSNNSGGRWWLKDEVWHALEKAGWTVEWVKDQKENRLFIDPDGERWLGALATRASKSFETPDEGIREWSEITSQDPWALGCRCCGRPHEFSYEDKDGNTHYPTTVTHVSHEGWD